MAKQGDWGGGGRSNIPDTVKRTRNVTPNATVSRATEVPMAGPAPVLKYYSEPNYIKPPYDPEFGRLDDVGNEDYKLNTYQAGRPRKR